MRRIIREERQAHWHWRESQVEKTVRYPTHEPARPKIGERRYDPTSQCLCIWDGLEWVVVPSD